VTEENVIIHTKRMEYRERQNSGNRIMRPAQEMLPTLRREKGRKNIDVYTRNFIPFCLIYYEWILKLFGFLYNDKYDKYLVTE
jgi:hypothetical protein